MSWIPRDAADQLISLREALPQASLPSIRAEATLRGYSELVIWIDDDPPPCSQISYQSV